MLSTFPPFGNVCWEDAYCRVVMVDYALHFNSCCSLPHKATSLWDTSPTCCMLMGLICSQIIAPLLVPLLVKHDSFNFFCSVVNNYSYFFCRTWRNICCYWCKRITTKCKWGICNFQWSPQVFFCSLILQINVNTNLILFRNHWWVTSYQRSSCVLKFLLTQGSCMLV